MGETRIRDPAAVERKIARITAGGAKALHVVSDFDRTLTKAFVEGERIHGVIALLREHGYLTPDYPDKAFLLYYKYHAMETDESLPLEERSRAMLEWWSEHIKLMVGSGMSRSVVRDIADKKRVVFREGALELLRALHERGVPVLVFSAALGDVITACLEREGALHQNVHIISNFFDYDPSGRARGYKGGIVHTFNKDESQVRGTPYERAITGRGNVIVLGDSLSDLAMVRGMNHDTVLSIGFLNEGVDERLPAFEKAYDVVITGDGTMDYALGIVKTVR